MRLTMDERTGPNNFYGPEWSGPVRGRELIGTVRGTIFWSEIDGPVRGPNFWSVFSGSVRDGPVRGPKLIGTVCGTKFGPRFWSEIYLVRSEV